MKQCPENGRIENLRAGFRRQISDARIVIAVQGMMFQRPIDHILGRKQGLNTAHHNRSIGKSEREFRKTFNRGLTIALPYEDSSISPWHQRRAVDLIVVQHDNVFGRSSGREPV
jgi:hypothetical protein